MRTAVIILCGLALLGVLVVLARWLGAIAGPATVTAAKVFLPLWLAVALVNLWIGVARAGYSIAEELPIFLAIFAIPGVVAGIVWWAFA